ncbi:unnamed protein product [Ambrosiozyma monospora]|uniref:Unnamed protein product n=1 Tax=Ambrosiozyma monospora TaxID=43982 RepID=A0ACB5TI38_AMBMO|nr:unnamed protein product [Ambrosiozyma monospora]
MLSKFTHILPPNPNTPCLQRDLYTLGGVTAIQELSGPKIQWRPGRVDLSESAIPPPTRLPDPTQTTGDFIRSVFGTRYGFNDRELVSLIGVGHSIGRCHANASGFDGPWTFSPTMVTNDFFTLLINEDWEFKKWDGPKQYTDVKTKSLMMLPSDMVFKTDPEFRKLSEEYAKDADKCLSDFAGAFSKLLELGAHFPASVEKFTLDTLDDQDL